MILCSESSRGKDQSIIPEDMRYIHLKVKHKLKDIAKRQMPVFLFLAPIPKKGPITLSLVVLTIGKFWIWLNSGLTRSGLSRTFQVLLTYLIKLSLSSFSKGIYGKLMNNATE